MNEFRLRIAPTTYENLVTRSTYIPKQLLGEGTYGSVYELNGGRILKLIKNGNENSFLQEVELQQKLYQKEPGVCPRISDYGVVVTTNEYIVVMEKMTGTVRDLLKTNPEAVIEFLKQAAMLFQRLEKYKFNHRDFKSDNAMYKQEDGKYRFVLIDFGFSCATIDGRTYSGTSYFKPREKCFRRSRDLAQCIYEIEKYTPNLPDTIRSFLRILLTFDIEGKKCEMFKGCPPHKIKSWLDSYAFLNRDKVENPHTTPEGLLQAIHVFETKGLEACKNGFLVDPVLNLCVPKPSNVVVPVLGKAETPVAPVVAAPASCPPGKVRNPKTRRCVKKTGIIGRQITEKDCPPDKIRNPKTRRCVKKTGSIGMKLTGL
jgi:serine/threonine protein kinase